MKNFCQICHIRQNRQIRQHGWLVFSLFASIWQFDEILPNLLLSPKSSNPPKWLASMCSAYLYWRNFAKFVTFAKIAKIVKSAKMTGFHVFSLFASIWQFEEILPNLSYSPKSSNPPTWLASMCSAYLHCIGSLAKFWQICQTSPKSPNLPTWLASMCLAYLHLFGSLTKFFQIRHRCDCGKISSKLPNSPLPAFLDIIAELF